MFKIEIVAVGKISATFVKEGEKEYLKRIRPFYDISVVELSEQKNLGNNSLDEQKIIEIEGEKILKYIGKRKYPIITLAIEGSKLSSLEFSKMISATTLSNSGLIFVIGGSLGLSEQVKKYADMLFSLSNMTLPHQMSRIILLKQIYRAATINSGKAYHK